MSAHCLEVMYWVGLGWEVREIDFAGGPDKLEVTLFDTVLNPVVSHGDGFGAADFGG